MTMTLPPIRYWGHTAPNTDKLHEECALFGCFGTPDAAVITVLGLHSLQHRGQEAAGIVTVKNGEFIQSKGKGLVGDIFGNRPLKNGMPAQAALGHTRYSTVRGQGMRNVQPLFAELALGGVAMAHNGNLNNSEVLRAQLIQKGHIFQSDLDSEVILHLLARSQSDNIIDAIDYALEQVNGGYGLIFLTKNTMVGARDRYGIRPLVLGKRSAGGWVLSSETCAFDLIGATFVRELAPGEIVWITSDGVQSLHTIPPKEPQTCIFEAVYFSRPDSMIKGQSVYQMRVNMGREVAKEIAYDNPALSASVVVPIPDSGTPAALGFSRQANIPLELGIVRNHYVGRTFIEPTQTVRNFGVRMKHSPNAGVLKDQDVVLIDDSLVRGTTASKIVEVVRSAGARSVHMVVASPPVRYPCVYGIDMPLESELLAAFQTLPQIAQTIKVDTIHFLSLDGLYRALGSPHHDIRPSYADHVFTGEYPTGISPLQQVPHQQLMFREVAASSENDQYR